MLALHQPQISDGHVIIQTRIQVMKTLKKHSQSPRVHGAIIVPYRIRTMDNGTSLVVNYIHIHRFGP